MHICKTYLCTPRKLLPAARNEGARDVRLGISAFPNTAVDKYGEIHMFIPEDKRAIANLDNHGYKRCHNTHIVPFLLIV